LVVTPDERVARWAAKPVYVGCEWWFTPYVLGPSCIPEVTDENLARDNPELAVLSAMAHGLKGDPARAIEIALAARKATVGLDAERADLYVDLVINSLSEAARQALTNMDLRKLKYEFQSEWAREQFREYLARGLEQGMAQGKAEGEALGELRGRAALVIRQLSARFGRVTPQVDDQIRHASIAELDAIGERLLTARTLQEALNT
jgi:flagellar biosynthesis/type III secretory pathway protein FliH